MSDAITTVYQSAGVISGLDANMRWQLDEAAVKQLIAASVLDTVFNWIKGGTNVKAIWDELKRLFEGHTKMIVVELRRKLQSTHCKEDESIHSHFDQLTDLCEQLAVMGKSITEEEYSFILLGSLLVLYEMVVNVITAAADISGNDITPAIVTHLALDEFNWCALKKGNDPGDESFAVVAQKSKHKKNIEWFNCKKCSHVKADCWAKGGGKEGKGLKNCGVKTDAAMAAEVWP
jgi:gag-polypeptide of LTR copia-type